MFYLIMCLSLQSTFGAPNLFNAIAANNASAVAEALAQGAEVNATIDDPKIGKKLTPLNLAVEKDEKIVRLLLEKGAQPNTFSDFYIGGFKDIRSFSPVMRASSLGRIKIVRLLIDYKADVNLATKSGLSPLISASSSDEMMKLLLKNGANPNASDDQGVTPLMAVVSGAAYDKSKTARARLLLNKGADPHAKDKNGRTAQDIAKSYGDEEMIKLLNEKSPDIVVKSGIGFVKKVDAFSGCYMAHIEDSQKTARERRYYFIEHADGGIMNIDGEDIAVTRTTTEELKQLEGKKRFKWNFSAPQAKVTFNLTVTKVVNEGEAVNYDVIITALKKGKNYTLKAYGFCGG